MSWTHDLDDYMKVISMYVINLCALFFNWFFLDGYELIMITCSTLGSVLSFAYVGTKFYREFIRNKKS